MHDLKLTLVQLDLKWQDKTQNLNQIERLLAWHKENTDIIILPEMFSTGFSMESQQLAEEMSGETVSWMTNVATQRKAAVCGSLIINDNGCYVNRCVWVDASGNIDYYDKHHLFSMVKENEHYSSGNQHTYIQHKNWKIQLLICYDLRFPVWCRNTNETDLQIFVANWPEKRSHHWKRLLETRAIENQCFVAGVNRIGKDNNGVYHSGDTSLFDYKGMCIHSVSDDESIQTFRIAKSELSEYRNRYPFLNDRDNFEIQ